MHFLPTAQIVSVFVVVLFLAYLTTILVPYAVRKPDPPGDASGYDWHSFVPCRDERAVIGQTLACLRETFPAGHIWVIAGRCRGVVAAITPGGTSPLDEPAHR